MTTRRKLLAQLERDLLPKRVGQDPLPMVEGLFVFAQLHSFTSTQSIKRLLSKKVCSLGLLSIIVFVTAMLGNTPLDSDWWTSHH